MRNFLFIVALMIAVVSCNKETRAKKNLWKKGGDWSITSYRWQYSSTDPDHPSYNGPIYYLSNCGSYKFSKDGTGTYSIIEDGDTYTESFKYSNTEDKLTIIESDGTVFEYEMYWKKNKIQIEYNKTETFPNGYTLKIHYKFELERKK